MQLAHIEPPVKEIRLIGRDGQGMLTACEILGRIAVRQGLCAQSMPSFGPEGPGALTQATLRLGQDEFLPRCTSSRPGAILIFDPGIWQRPEVYEGIGSGALIVLNSTSTGLFGVILKISHLFSILLLL